MEAAAVGLDLGSAFWAWAAGVDETLKSFCGLAALDLGLAALCVLCCSSVPGSLKAVWNSLRSFLTSLGISTLPSRTPLQISCEPEPEIAGSGAGAGAGASRV